MSTGGSATSQKSVQDAKLRLRKFLKTIDTKPTQILEDEATTLYAEILLEVPYKTGKLERSVRVKVAHDKRRPGINASASALSKHMYNYAGIQHENENFHHKKYSAKAHYISDPFNRATKRIIKRTRKELKLR